MTATKNVEASRWLAWASILTRRFAVQSRRRPGLPFELLRHRSSVVLRRIAWHPTIAVNVSLSYADTRVVADPREREAMTLGSPWRAANALNGPVITSPSLWGAPPAMVGSGPIWPAVRSIPHARRLIDDQLVHALIKRVTARTDRVEWRAAGRDLVLAVPAAAAAPRRTVESELLPASKASHRRLSNDPWSGREASASPVNVDRIADQVLQQLDRRVTAWRERMGRA
jgi:hypothetical protein